MLGLISCKKEINNPQLDITKITFGNPETNLMNRFLFDPPMQITSWANGGHVFDSIDIHEDGTFDIAFVSFGQKWANSSYCEIYSLNDSAEILIDIVNDTVFQCFDNQNPEISANLVRYNAKSGFYTYSENDSILSISSINHPRMFDIGDELMLSDSALSWNNTALFTRYAEGYWYYPQDIYIRYRNGYWNDMNEKYLCIRIKTNSNTKYGWIKVSIENNIKINVYEYSISR